MRKADYATLARTIARDITEYDRAIRDTNDDRLRMLASAGRTALRNLAVDFARSASIDRAAWLRACGINPDNQS